MELSNFTKLRTDSGECVRPWRATLGLRAGSKGVSCLRAQVRQDNSYLEQHTTGQSGGLTQ